MTQTAHLSNGTNGVANGTNGANGSNGVAQAASGVADSIANGFSDFANTVANGVSNVANNNYKPRANSLTADGSIVISAADRTWWKEAVIYQIYPSSFCDTDGDGIGNINGVTSKLDYLKELGVDVVWLTPIYESPQKDMGYDISNYRAIHKPYGTMEDVENLIAELKKREMRLIMDLVVNHTSDQHPFFIESRSSTDNPKRDWYIWRKPRYDAQGVPRPPNNWACILDEANSAWTYDETTQQYYLSGRSGARIYLEASAVGLLRSIAGLPLEHPFDSVKSKMQAEINRKVGFLEMTKEIYKTHGVSKGLYAGFIPSAIRGAVKQVYRWPLMLVLPRVYSSMYPDSIKQMYPSIAKITTGLTLAAVDTFIVCPFERLKVCLQTKKDNLSIQKFFRQNNKHLFQSLFQGLNSLFYRQMVSWVSFLYTDYKFKEMAREYKGIDKNTPLDNQTLFITSLLVGVSNVFVVMPFDMTKTLYQQHSNEFVNKKFSETLRIVYNKNGLKGFYYGWQPRMIQYMIQSVFTVTALEKMEHKLKNSV